MTTKLNEQEQEALTSQIIDYLSEGGSLQSMAGLSDTDMEAVYAVGFNFFTAGKYDKAIEMFQFLCMNDHTESRWFYSLGVANQAAGNYSAAVNAYGMATILDVENPAPQAQAGYCLLALGNRDAAKAALEGAVMMCGEEPEHAGIKEQAEALLKTMDGQKTGATAKEK